MPKAQDVLWFKQEFQPAIESAVAGTPFSVDMIVAFACQETGGIWPALRGKGLPTARILELCVGDTIDGTSTGGRRAFPKDKAELLAMARGNDMFEIARQGLLDMAAYIPAYRSSASRPDKFCHGFGIFQLDLQFFRTDPDYFLERRYADFGAALAKCVEALRGALKRLGWAAKTSLSDEETAAVAIAYNTGRFNAAKGLKQGYFDGTKYYGESYFAYLQLAKSVQPAPATAPGAPERTARSAPRAAPAKRARKKRQASPETAAAAGAVPAKARPRKKRHASPDTVEAAGVAPAKARPRKTRHASPDTAAAAGAVPAKAKARKRAGAGAAKSR